MCGINGFISTKEHSIQDMNALVSHRGPDFAGEYNDGSVHLGHTLLSIRDDVNKSHQPVQRKGSPWVLSYNGQLYNTKQLKQLLGSQYQNEDLDTTLLFNLIEKFGWDFITKIHGMFAIALYNKEEKVMKLYRDPSGQKLLYYYHYNDSLIFSSEIKGILSHTSINKEKDNDAVMVALTLGYIPGSKTLFKHIKKVQPSESVAYHIPSKNLETSYFKSNSDNYYDGEKDVFASLIGEHLQSKQKVALNLSGGLDSSLLLHEMNQQSNDVHTYTNYFEGGDEKYNTDAKLARKLSKDYGTHHTEICITKKAYLENFIDSYTAIEEPNYNISLPTYLITAKHEGIHGDKNRVILSGDGGDEVFGGYAHHYQNIRLDQQQKFLTPFLVNYIKNKRNNTSFDFSDPIGRWMFYKDLREKSLLKEHNFDVSKYIETIFSEFNALYSVKKDSVYNAMMMDRLIWLSGENFIRSDKLYMSESLELRSPLSYHPFREYFDKKLKTDEYIDKNINKLFLREYYTNKLPDYIVNRPDKTGWRAPIEMWYDSEFKDVFLSIIRDVENNNSLIDWKKVKASIEKKEVWPGKLTHLYLSLALLSKKFDLDL